MHCCSFKFLLNKFKILIQLAVRLRSCLHHSWNRLLLSMSRKKIKQHHFFFLSSLVSLDCCTKAFEIFTVKSGILTTLDLKHILSYKECQREQDEDQTACFILFILIRLKNITNSRPNWPRICKNFSRLTFLGLSTLEKFKIKLEKIVLTLVQNNYGNKIPYLWLFPFIYDYSN